MSAEPELSCSIGIPVYNRVAFLDAALRSATPALAKGADVTVVDDGSRDDVRDALRSLVPAGVTLVRNERNLGLFGNWNRCLELARGRAFGVLCSDDAFLPGFVEAATAVLERWPNVALVTTRGLLRGPDGAPLGEIGGFFPEGVYDGPAAVPVLLDFYARTGHNPFNYPSGVLVRTDVARAAGGFDTALRHTGDLDFFYRVLARGDLAVLDLAGCAVTIHPGQQGQILAQEPIGMRELVEMIARLPSTLVGETERRALLRQHRALALWHALRYRRHGDLGSYAKYRDFARGGGVGTPGLLAGLVRLAAGKVEVRLRGHGTRWARRLRRLGEPR